jgi:UDP-N-acetylmuramate: L-alanyl-gamma-D-glutamyl-meso-diaminopimelate ligase
LVVNFSETHMSDPKHFHFTGVCGTAMGAVAVAMKRKGFTVTGSDNNVYPPMSDFLRGEGITITEGYRAENLPAGADVIVIGNAISRGNEEAEAARQCGVHLLQGYLFGKPSPSWFASATVP